MKKVPINDFNQLSLETVTKLQIKINEMQDYFLFYQNYKDNFDSHDQNIFRKLVHKTIYVLYRSMFKSIEGKHIDIAMFSGYRDIESVHKAIISIVDKDICHHDKNSNTHKIMSVSDLLNYGHTEVVQSYLSDEQLEKITEFLTNEVLIKIQNRRIKL